MSRRASRLILLGLVLGHFLLALAYSVVNPLGEAPDEADHWAYIVHLARERELPVGPKRTQSKHPPLYHATAALAASLAEPTNNFLRSNPDVEFTPRAGWSPNSFIHTTVEDWPWRDGVLAFHLARLWSVFLTTLTVAAIYPLARSALPGWPTVAFGATAVLAFLPEFAFIGGSTNNDNAAALFGTLALWGMFALWRGAGRFRAGWWTPLALGLGLLSKASTLSLWPVVGLGIVLGAAAGQTNDQGGLRSLHYRPAAAFLRRVLSTWRTWVITGLLVFVPALLIAAPWLLRNWQLYGDPLGMALVRQTVDLRTAPWTWADTTWLLRGWFVSFWGRFGGAGQIPLPAWLYGLLALASLASLFGLVRVFSSRTWRDARLPVLLMAAAVGSVALGIWQYSLIALGTDQGRLLFPAVGAIVILWVIGILALFPVRHGGQVAIGLGAFSLALGLYGLFGVIAPAYVPPQPVRAEDWHPAAAASPVDFGELALVGWTLDPDPVLYWRADTAPSQDWRTVLRVSAEDGTVVWETRRSPGAGRWSTDRWPAGFVMRDAYRVTWPDWAGSGRYRVDVGLQPFGKDLVLPAAAGQPAADQEHSTVLLGWLER